MKSLLKVAVAGILFVFLGSAAAQAQPVPGMLNVQGVLRNLYGEPVTGTYDVEFRLYDTASGGVAFYSEPPVTMTLVGGVFNTYLSAPSSQFKTRTNAYLGVRIRLNGTSIWDAELPRTQVTSVAYAYQAEEADVALLANDLSCSGCVSSGEVSFNYAGSTSPGGPATSLACTECITTEHIRNKTIIRDDLADDIAYSTTNTMTATQFIDANNTNYYLDPNATSNLANVNADIFRYRQRVVYSPGGADTNVGLWGENFATTSLNGISNGGTLYISGGHQNGCSGTVQVFGNLCAAGTRNFRVLGEAHANRYYDQNNGSFYVDPASASMVNTMYFSTTASTTTGSYINLAGANKFVGGTAAFDVDWTDLNDSAFKLNPNATSKFDQFQTNGVQLTGMPGYGVNIGVFTGFAGIGTAGGHFYMGPNSTYSEYAIMRYAADDRIYFTLNGLANTNRPNLRTNANYLAISSGGTSTNLSGLGTARELLLQWNHDDNSTTRTIVKGNIHSSQYWGRSNVAYDCKLEPNGKSSLLNVDANYLYGYYGRFATLQAGGIQMESNSIQPAGHHASNIGTETSAFASIYVHNVFSRAQGSYSTRASKREITYLDDLDAAGVGEVIESFKPVTYFYNWEVKPEEVAAGVEAEPYNVREVPHWGLILEEMPKFMETNDGGYWSPQDSTGFLLVAAKYQQEQNKQLKRQIADLEDRIALMEQVLVDAGLIR